MDIPDAMAPQEQAARLRSACLQRAMPHGVGWPFGIVDSAVDERLYDLLQAEPAQSQVQCLYDGYAGIRYARYAPYLLALHSGSPLFARWLAQGWEAHWGIFVGSNLAGTALKRHLKRFLQATDPEGKPVWVRYYDPRVLPPLLAGLNPDHQAEWFGRGTLQACLAPTPTGLWRVMPRQHAGRLMHALGAVRLDEQHFPF